MKSAFLQVGLNVVLAFIGPVKVTSLMIASHGRRDILELTSRLLVVENLSQMGLLTWSKGSRSKDLIISQVRAWGGQGPRRLEH
jgi:hypothetical protein